jgi:hypothetical protein
VCSGGLFSLAGVPPAVFSFPGPRPVEVFHDQGIRRFVPEDRRGEPLEQGRLGPSDWADCWDRQDLDGDYPTEKIAKVPAWAPFLRMWQGDTLVPKASPVF